MGRKETRGNGRKKAHLPKRGDYLTRSAIWVCDVLGVRSTPVSPSETLHAHRLNWALYGISIGP
jgi:hypothetical protein